MLQCVAIAEQQKLLICHILIVITVVMVNKDIHRPITRQGCIAMHCNLKPPEVVLRFNY